MKPPSGAETDQYRYLTFNIHQAAVPQGFSHLHQDDTLPLRRDGMLVPDERALEALAPSKM
jgi:hypothetical protein